jgi:hypothetical protein
MISQRLTLDTTPVISLSLHRFSKKRSAPGSEPSIGLEAA